jgi:hypothetical protein
VCSITFRGGFLGWNQAKVTIGVSNLLAVLEWGLAMPTLCGLPTHGQLQSEIVIVESECLGDQNPRIVGEE